MSLKIMYVYGIGDFSPQGFRNVFLGSQQFFNYSKLDVPGKSSFALLVVIEILGDIYAVHASVSKLVDIRKVATRAVSPLLPEAQVTHSRPLLWVIHFCKCFPTAVPCSKRLPVSILQDVFMLYR